MIDVFLPNYTLILLIINIFLGENNGKSGEFSKK